MRYFKPEDCNGCCDREAPLGRWTGEPAMADAEARVADCRQSAAVPGTSPRCSATRQQHELAHRPWRRCCRSFARAWRAVQSAAGQPASAPPKCKASSTAGTRPLHCLYQWRLGNGPTTRHFHQQGRRGHQQAPPPSAARAKVSGLLLEYTTWVHESLLLQAHTMCLATKQI